MTFTPLIKHIIQFIILAGSVLLMLYINHYQSKYPKLSRKLDLIVICEVIIFTVALIGMLVLTLKTFTTSELIQTITVIVIAIYVILISFAHKFPNNHWFKSFTKFDNIWVDSGLIVVLLGILVLIV